MKTTLFLATLLALAVPASADLFTGSMLFTVTKANTCLYDEADASWTAQPFIDGLPVGSTFDGWYSYESDSIDGHFSARETLTGAIDLPAQLSARGALDFAFWPWSLGLLVEDGQVAGFSFCPTAGPINANFFFATWQIGNAGLNTSARGTVSWSDPSAQLANRVSFVAVPDGLNVGGWLGLVLGLALGVATWRNHRRTV